MTELNFFALRTHTARLTQCTPFSALAMVHCLLTYAVHRVCCRCGLANDVLEALIYGLCCMLELAATVI